MISFLFNWYLILFPVMVPLILYIIIFRRIPIPNPKEDAKTLGMFFDMMVENAERHKAEQGQRKHNPDDYWEEEVDYATGEVTTNTGPTIRHPKNSNRAYESSP